MPGQDQTPMPDAERLEEGRAILASQPFSRLLGAELAELGERRAELRLVIRDEHRQHLGSAHGGVIGYLADNAMAFAASEGLTVNVVTAEFKINYLRPAVGDRLIARAEAVGAGRSLTVARCDLYTVEAGAEKLCATAQGTISRLGPLQIAGRERAAPAA
jgi:uncharacterized protein (TIGR00369 family)